MPTIDHLNERPHCRVPLCPNLVEVKEETPQGRYRIRNVCSYHWKNKGEIVVTNASGAGAPTRGGISFIPRNCAFPLCDKTTTSLGRRQNRQFYSKWCARHRDKRMRDLELSHRPELKRVPVAGEEIVVVPRRIQSDTMPHARRNRRPLHRPSPKTPIDLPTNPRHQKIATWKHGPAVALNHAIIDPMYPGERVVMNDSGYAVWATLTMVAAMDIALQHGYDSLDACRRAMMRVAPTQYWPKESPVEGDTIPRVSSALVLLLQGWLRDVTRRKQMKLGKLPKIVEKVDRGAAEREAEKMLQMYLGEDE